MALKRESWPTLISRLILNSLSLSRSDMEDRTCLMSRVLSMARWVFWVPRISIFHPLSWSALRQLSVHLWDICGSTDEVPRHQGDLNWLPSLSRKAGLAAEQRELFQSDSQAMLRNNCNVCRAVVIRIQ